MCDSKKLFEEDESEVEERSIFWPWQKISDVQIVIGRHVYHCNSSVLRTFCSIFARNLVPGEKVRLPREEIDAEAFVIAYKWMISSDSNCPRSKILDLLMAADYLRAPKLFQSVHGALWDDRYFSNADAFNLYADAVYKGQLYVAYLMLMRFGKCFLTLVSTEDYRVLSVEAVTLLLGSDHLGVHTEVEVFYAALIWLLGDYQSRKCHMRSLLAKVRFEMMPSLVHLNFGERLGELVPDDVDLMHFLLDLAIINNQERAVMPKGRGVARPRTFIRDPKCPYLSLLEDDTEELSASLFKDYILSLESYEAFKSRIIEVDEVNENDQDADDEYDEHDEESDDEEDDTPAKGANVGRQAEQSDAEGEGGEAFAVIVYKQGVEEEYDGDGEDCEEETDQEETEL